MPNLYAMATDVERHLSQVAADIWGCAPYFDWGNTRYPLCMDMIGEETAFHPQSQHGNEHGVRVAPSVVESGTVATFEDPPAVITANTQSLCMAPVGWRQACERVHALTQAEPSIPIEKMMGAAGRGESEDSGVEQRGSIVQLQRHQWTISDGKGIAAVPHRLMDEQARPTYHPPFWRIAIWVDMKRPIASVVVREADLYAMRRHAIRLYRAFEDRAPALRRWAEKEGWAAVMRAFDSQ